MKRLRLYRTTNRTPDKSVVIEIYDAKIEFDYNLICYDDDRMLVNRVGAIGCTSGDWVTDDGNLVTKVIALTTESWRLDSVCVQREWFKEVTGCFIVNFLSVGSSVITPTVQSHLNVPESLVSEFFLR